MSIRVDLETAAAICKVKPATVMRWARDGFVTVERRKNYLTGRTHNLYDVHELLHWIDARNPNALMVQAGMSGGHADQLRRGAC